MGLISISPIPGESLISSVVNLGTSLIDRLFPNPADRDKAKLALLEMQQKGELAQLDADLKLALAQVEVNRTEAATGSLFIGGWRPAIGWVCALAIAGQFIAHPLVQWYMAYNHLDVTIPSFDFTSLMTIVLSLLGVGALRTVEKIKGVA